MGTLKNWPQETWAARLGPDRGAELMLEEPRQGKIPSEVLRYIPAEGHQAEASKRLRELAEVVASDYDWVSTDLTEIANELAALDTPEPTDTPPASVPSGADEGKRPRRWKLWNVARSGGEDWRGCQGPATNPADDCGLIGTAWMEAATVEVVEVPPNDSLDRVADAIEVVALGGDEGDAAPREHYIDLARQIAAALDRKDLFYADAEGAVADIDEVLKHEELTAAQALDRIEAIVNGPYPAQRDSRLTKEQCLTQFARNPAFLQRLLDVAEANRGRPWPSQRDEQCAVIEERIAAAFKDNQPPATTQAGSEGEGK